MPQVGDTKKFYQVLGFKSLGPFLRVCKQGSCFTAREGNRGDERLGQFELACEADGGLVLPLLPLLRQF